MNTSAAYSVTIVGILLITSGLSAPSVNSEGNPNRTKRNLLNLLIGGLLPPTTKPPSEATAAPVPEAATDSEEMSSGNGEIAVASFNASLAGDVQLPPIKLPLPVRRRSIKYNFFRIGSVINWNTAGNQGFVDLRNGIFTAPVAGKYRITMRVHVNVYKIEGPKNVAGIAICLNEICNGRLDRTALYSLMPAIGGNHVFKAAASLVLQENDSVKFLVFKTPQTGIQLLKETSVYGIQEPSY